MSSAEILHSDGLMDQGAPGLESDVLLTKTEGSISHIVWEAEGSTASEPRGCGRALEEGPLTSPVQAARHRHVEGAGHQMASVASVL